MQGTIARLVPDRGFGFVNTDDGREFFFHRSALKATDYEELAEGQSVELEVGHDPGDKPGEDLRAVNVHLAADALPADDNVPLPEEKTS